MAKGVKFGGEIDTAYWISAVKNAKSEEDARRIVKQAMNATTAGFFNVGVSKGDQKAVTEVINAFGKKYNADVSAALKIWDPKKDIKSISLKDNVNMSMDVLGRSNSLKQYVDKEPIPEGQTNAEFVSSSSSSTKKPSTGTGTKSPSTSASTTVTTSTPAVKEFPKIDWQNKPIDEMAEILGIEKYKTADILAMYNEATNKKFDELDTEVKRYQAENLRALEGNYQSYLNTLRENKANAISNGITKGAAAAQQLASMIAGAQAVSDSQQNYYDQLYDIAQQRGTALAENETTAYKDRQAIEQYLGSLRSTYEANSVNELAARLANSSQVQAAQIQADATTKAAGINAAATKEAAATSAASANISYDSFYNLVKKHLNGDPVATYILDNNYYQQYPVTK